MAGNLRRLSSGARFSGGFDGGTDLQTGKDSDAVGHRQDPGVGPRLRAGAATRDRAVDGLDLVRRHAFAGAAAVRDRRGGRPHDRQPRARRVPARRGAPRGADRGLRPRQFAARDDRGGRRGEDPLPRHHERHARAGRRPGRGARAGRGGGQLLGAGGTDPRGVRRVGRPRHRVRRARAPVRPRGRLRRGPPREDGEARPPARRCCASTR